MNKCTDCGNTEAFEFRASVTAWKKKHDPNAFWLCLKCLQKRANSPESAAGRQLAEFLKKGGKPS
jgi:hypothetical protein